MSNQAEPPAEVRLPDGESLTAVSESDARHLYDQVFGERIYARHGLQYEPGAVVVDVGANIGMFLRFVATQTPAVRYIGLEPIPAIFAALQANGARFHRPGGLDLSLLNVGLSDQAGQASFDYFPNQPCCSTMYECRTDDDRQRAREFTLEMAAKSLARPLGWLLLRAPRAVRNSVADWIMARYGRAEKVECPLLTLSQVIDQLGLTRIDLLKIDAERAELAILRGIETRHWPLIRQAVIEVHWDSGPEYDEIRQRLAEAGFELFVESNPDFDGTPLLYARRGAAEGTLSDDSTSGPVATSARGATQD